MEDIGRIYWNSSSVYFHYDSSAGFTGWDIVNGDFSDKTFFLDTFSDLSYNGIRQKYQTSLNPRANLCGFLNVPVLSTVFNGGIYFITGKHLVPGFYINAGFKPFRNFEITPGFIYDHYRKTGFSIEGALRLGSSFIATLGTYHLENLFVPLNNQSLYLTLKMNVK